MKYYQIKIKEEYINNNLINLDKHNKMISMIKW